MMNKRKMTIEHALALFAVMPAADQHKLYVECGWAHWHDWLSPLRNECPCKDCAELRGKFLAAVSAKADEIERLMLAEQKTWGSA